MPRRNLLILIVVSIVSLLCYQRVQRNLYGRIVVDAMDHIETRYLRDVGQEQLFEGAMEGMVSRLDDQYSSFISAEQLQQFNENLDQRFGGIGVEVSLDPNTQLLTVTNPVIGDPWPAYEAGIRTGDRVLRIDGQSTQGLSLDDTVQLMRGQPDSPVTLSVLHPPDQEPADVKMLRKIIRIDTVQGDVREPDLSWNYFLTGSDRIGYVRVRAFAENTGDDLKNAMDWLMERRMRGLILDLRGDPGGLLSAAKQVCDMFIDSGVIVTERRRNGQIVTPASRPGTYPCFPMAVLVNHDSASASEIVAACLQDHGRAVVVGQRTWGKGTVQEVHHLEAGRGALKLTTASYWRPSMVNIHRGKNDDDDDVWGVTPDEGFEVAVGDDEALKRWHRWRLRRDIWKLDGSSLNDDDTSSPSPDTPLAEVDPVLAKAAQWMEGAVGSGQKAVGSGQ